MAQLNLARDPILPLLLRMAIPTSVGFFFNTLYNLIDTYWAGKVSVAALAGLGVSFPLYLVLIGIAVGLGQGTTVLVAHAVGRSDDREGAQVLKQAGKLAILGGLLMILVGLPILTLVLPLVAPDAETAQAAWSYFLPILVCNLFFTLSYTLNAGLSAVGDTLTLSISMVVSAILNMGLDPLFIYGLSWQGLQLVPPMGIMGIGIATVVSQFLGLLFVFYRLRFTSLWPYLAPRSFHIDWGLIRQLLAQSVPAAMNMAAVSVGFLIMFSFVKSFGAEATAGFTAGLRIEQMALLPAIGLNTACVALVGQNMGANQPARVLLSFRLAILMGLVILNIGGMLIFAFAHPLVSFFTDTAQTAAYGERYLKIIAFEYTALCFIMLGGGFLQGVKRPGLVFLVTVARICLTPLVVIPLLVYGLNWGFDGIWLGVLIGSYGFALVLIVLVNRVSYNLLGKAALPLPLGFTK